MMLRALMFALLYASSVVAEASSSWSSSISSSPSSSSSSSTAVVPCGPEGAICAAVAALAMRCVSASGVAVSVD